MIQINGVEIAAPKSFQFSLNDIDGETNRNAKGEMIRDRIAVKRKLELEWGPLTMSECSAILKAVQSEYFSVTYPDALEGKMLTKTMYVGDRTSPMYTFKNDKAYWTSLKMNFIEK